MKRRGRLIIILATLLTTLAGAFGGGGCARRGTVPSSPATAVTRIEPLQLMREDLSDAQERKIHIKLVVPANASNEQIDALLHRVAAGEELTSGVLWLSVFLEGMDLNSVAYAFGMARPGETTFPINYRQSLQTYR